MAHLLESFGALERLSGFVSEFGRAFYKRGPRVPTNVILVRGEEENVIPDTFFNAPGQDVVTPFWAGKQLKWKILEN